MIWRIGTTSGLLVDLEPCSGCSTAGWGWQDSAWWKADYAVVKFSTTGTHTIRGTRVSDGNDQPSANSELRNQRFRNCWTTSGDEYAVVRSMRGPAKRAVETFHSRIVDFQLANTRLRLAREIANALDRINLRRDP